MATTKVSLQAPPASVNILPTGKFTKLHRVSPVEPWRALRTKLRKEGKGLWRFVEGGKRYLAGEWPEDDFPAFDEEGTSTIYDEVPASEAPPEYEPLAPSSP